MSKPREFAHLIKNKFGSADNINQLSSSECNFEVEHALIGCGRGIVVGSLFVSVPGKWTLDSV